jgi:hypothetical protein
MKRTVLVAAAGLLLLAVDSARSETTSHPFVGEPQTMLLVGSSLLALASLKTKRP